MSDSARDSSHSTIHVQALIFTFTLNISRHFLATFRLIPRDLEITYLQGKYSLNDIMVSTEFAWSFMNPTLQDSWWHFSKRNQLITWHTCLYWHIPQFLTNLQLFNTLFFGMQRKLNKEDTLFFYIDLRCILKWKYIYWLLILLSFKMKPIYTPII